MGRVEMFRSRVRGSSGFVSFRVYAEIGTAFALLPGLEDSPYAGPPPRGFFRASPLSSPPSLKKMGALRHLPPAMRVPPSGLPPSISIRPSADLHRYQGTSYLDSGTSYLNPGTTFLNPGTTYLNPGTSLPLLLGPRTPTRWAGRGCGLTRSRREPKSEEP